MSGHRVRAWLLPVVGTTLTGAAMAAHLRLLQTRGFGPDELEHSHFAWNVWNGQVPYRDYFEHHTPAFHALLQPLFHFYPPEGSGEDALAFLTAARALMWALSVGMLLCTFLLARRVAGASVGAVAVVLLVASPIFLDKTIEVRPDVPATLLLVVALLLCCRALGHDAQPAARRLGLAAGGACLGLAFLTTQKLLFAAPGIGAGLAWIAAGGRLSHWRRVRVAWPAAAGAGLVVGIALLVLWAEQALGAFVHQAFLVNAAWPGLGPASFLQSWAREDPLFVLLCAVGLGAQLMRLRDDRAVARGEPLITLTAASLLASLAVHPAVTFHYFLLMLPLLAIGAADCAVRLGRTTVRLLARLRPPLRPALALGMALLVSGALWAHTVSSNRDALRHHGAGPAVAALVLVLLTLSWDRRAPRAVVAMLLLALSVPAALRLNASLHRGNWLTVQGLRYVQRNSAPTEQVLDGFSGLGAFRAQPFFHAFHHSHTLAIQTQAEKDGMVDDLEAGRALPKLLLWDAFLEEGISPRMREYLLKHYVRTGLHPIWVRPFDNGLGFWRDDAPRPFGWTLGQERMPHVLFDERWMVPAMESGRASRWTRTSHAGFVVPIRLVRDYRASLSAMAAPGAQPFSVRLEVNKHLAGTVAVTAGWGTYDFDVPQAWLIPGFNRFRLVFSAHGASGTEPRLAVESMTLLRR